MLICPIDDTTCVRCGAGEIGFGTKDEPTCVKVYAHCDACMDEPSRVGTVTKDGRDKREQSRQAKRAAIQRLAEQRVGEVLAA